jgi:hypothetical protein
MTKLGSYMIDGTVHRHAVLCRYQSPLGPVIAAGIRRTGFHRYFHVLGVYPATRLTLSEPVEGS